MENTNAVSGCIFLCCSAKLSPNCYTESMTGRTHDLAAFSALTYIVATTPLIHMSLSTALVALTANVIGGLTPDIDQPTADLWHKLPGGTVYSRIFTPLLGGHRFISHSFLGVVIFGLLAKGILILMSHSLLTNMDIVWWAFMIGYLSHLVLDTFTKEGVPWLFPIPVKIGIPPLSFLRIKTGGFLEKYVLFPGIILLTGYIIWTHYPHVLLFIQSFRH